MWIWILGFLVAVAAFTLMTYVTWRWVGKYIQRMITERLQAIEQIVNHEQVPTAWLRSYRKRATKLIAAGATDRQITQLSHIARKRCLANVKDLMHYVHDAGITDTPDTKRLVLTKLKEQSERWRDDDTWDELVDLRAPEPPPVHDAEADAS